MSRLILAGMKNTAFLEKLPQFTVVGHRGASRRHMGNTLESFRELRKISKKAMLELDVWPTSDGRIIIYHDHIFELSTDGNGDIPTRNYEYVRGLDAGYSQTFDNGKSFPFRGKGYRIPLFTDFLEEFRSSIMSIDIKYDNLDFARDVVKTLRDLKMHGNCTIGSFHNRIIRYLQSHETDLNTSFCRADTVRFFVLHKLHLSPLFRSRSGIMMISEFSDPNQPELLVPSPGETVRQGFRVITPRFIRDANARGIPVFAWTINNPDNMKRLVEWGVNGIVTDHPDVLLKIARAAGYEI